jgi:hypothetical protein
MFDPGIHIPDVYYSQMKVIGKRKTEQIATIETIPFS